MSIHGGDIYQNEVNIDFSVNINPFGMPLSVEQALLSAVKKAGCYPEYGSLELAKRVGKQLKVPAENLLFGNGASELFMAILQGLTPQKVRIPVPSFYGYEHAALGANVQVDFFDYREENGFGFPALEEDGIPKWMQKLTDDTDCLILANPNNPTGKLMEENVWKMLLGLCHQKEILVILDECFIEFCEGAVSVVRDLSAYPNVLLVRAFTKSYAIPGVRLGYLVGYRKDWLEKIRAKLPEWNVSVFAQRAGFACVEEEEYVTKTAGFVKMERAYLEEKLKELGTKTYPGEANFLLFYSAKPLYEPLLQKGILIRNCENIRGLGKGFYRVAVKQREENDRLLKAIEECMDGQK